MFFKIVENLFTLIFGLIGEEKSAMSLKILSNFIGIRFESAFFISAQRNSYNFIFAHEEFGVSECLSERLEVVGAHVIEGENVEILELFEEVVHLIDYELFVFSEFWFDFGEGDQFISLSFGHQQ